MHDEYQGREYSGFHAVANSFTQGLRDLPTDYVTRVRNFLAEYLGHAQHPVPFGGRGRDFEQLNSWLSDALAEPYLLLAAPAGRGKSALLLRWCQMLYADKHLAVAYFPVSIRFRTNLAGVVFPALVALLAHLHGEKVPNDPNMHEEVWRGLLSAYLARPLPDGRTLVLVLDGIDEAADWTADQTLFPEKPPAGLRIVLSARYLANDQNAQAWLQRLGWTRPGLAQTLELLPLDRSGITNVLVQMGFPLDFLGTRIDIIAELYRLSEGDPLLVRLYVDDLWTRGEAATHFQVDDLRALRPGLAGYFARWWQDQYLLWAADADQRQATTQLMLNLLAGALGPLSRQDILSLLHTEATFETDEIAEQLAPLARFVTGDGVHQGYVFSHPRLGNYFLEERLHEDERRLVEVRFLRWGAETLVALNTRQLAPEKASSYIVQYYGAHLECAHAETPALLALVSDGWRCAWEKLDRANAGFLGDARRALRAAERTDKAATSSGAHAPYLGEEIRSLLSQVSVNSMTSNISPRLMLEAVKTGIWTPAQGLACIRLITDLAPRAQELVGLAAFVQEPQRSDILQEALDTVMSIKDAYAHLDAIVAIAPGLTLELLWQVMEIVPGIEDEADRAGLLIELLPALSLHTALIEKALDLIQQMEEPEYHAMALEGLAAGFSTQQHSRVFQILHAIQDERDRTQTLIALIPYLSEDLLQQLLQEARDVQDELSRLRLFVELTTYLPEQTKKEALQEVLTQALAYTEIEYRVEVLVKLAPWLDTDRLNQAIQEIQLLWDENARAHALVQLIPYMSADQLAPLLHSILDIKSEPARVAALKPLLSRLPAELLQDVLANASSIWDEGCRAELISQCAPYVTEDLRPYLLDAIETIQDQGYHIWVLTEITAYLHADPHDDRFDVALLFQNMPDKEEQLQTLLAIAPRLSTPATQRIFDFMLPAIFNSMWRLQQSEEQRAYVISRLGAYLSADWITQALEMTTRMNTANQVQVLLALAPRVQGEHFIRALDITRSMQDREKRALVLEHLISALPEEHKGEMIHRMLQVLQVIKDELTRSQLIVTYAPYLPAQLPTALAQTVLDAVQLMLDENNQVYLLKALLAQMPTNTFTEILGIARGIREQELQISLLEALAPHIPAELFADLRIIVQTIQHEHQRMHLLASMIPYMPQSMLIEMLTRIAEIDDENSRSELLRSLIPLMHSAYFTQLWNATLNITQQGRRGLVLSVLIPYTPEEFFPRLWETVRALYQDGQNLFIMRILAVHIPQKFFPQLWDSVQAIRDRERRTQILSVLLPHTPEPFFEEIWAEVRKYPDAAQYWRSLGEIAVRVADENFPQFLLNVQQIPQEVVRAQVIDNIIPDTPEEFFPQLWSLIQSLQNKNQQARTLIKLASYIPNSSFPQVWEVLQTIEQEGVRLLAQNALFPQLAREYPHVAMKIVQKMLYSENQLQLLQIVVPYLSAEQCEETLQIILPESAEVWLVTPAQETHARRWCLRALAVLVPRLPVQRTRILRPTLLQATQELQSPEEQTWILAELAKRASEEWLPEILTTLWSSRLTPYRIQVLEVLLPLLSQHGWEIVVDATLTQLRQTGDIHYALQVFNAANRSVQQLTPALLYPLMYEILQHQMQDVRQDMLGSLILLAPATRATGGEQAIIAACTATLEIGIWWP